jgi:putative DNA primase/helicase
MFLSVLIATRGFQRTIHRSYGISVFNPLRSVKSWYMESNKPENLTPPPVQAESTGDGVVFLNVPFADKDLAKQLGARWDGERRSWYAMPDDEHILERWPVKTSTPIKINSVETNGEKIFLSVPFADKDEAKALGAKWDKGQKKWFVTNKESEVVQRWPPSPSITNSNSNTFVKGQNNNMTSHNGMDNGVKIYLAVPFDSNYEAKTQGARWDKDRKAWYTTDPHSPLVDRWGSG